MLEAFEASHTPTADIQELEQAGFSHQEDKFIFHLCILADQHFVEREHVLRIAAEACLPRPNIPLMKPKNSF